ncbi:MAG: hypothetical protein ABIM59_00165 [candidate division WOR-3 bacterium]
MTLQISWGLCDEGYAWWTQELLDCYYEPNTGHSARLWAGADTGGLFSDGFTHEFKLIGLYPDKGEARVLKTQK